MQLTWDKNNPMKVSKKNDDMIEGLYRLMLINPVYINKNLQEQLQNKNKRIKKLTGRTVSY